MKKRAILIALLLAPFGPALAESQIFEQPRIKGKLLDYCYTWGQECGQLAADRFCAMHDFATAADFGERAGPLGEPTMLISDGRICDAPDCGSFEYIACEGSLTGTPTPEPAPAVTRFDKPVIAGLRIDWCYSWASDCGQRAADRICTMNGFKQANAYKIDEDIGHTIVLSTGDVCQDPSCDGFDYVDCGN